MNQFNASAWALEHKSFVGFLMVLLAVAGLLSFDHLGRDEDPPFTIKVMVVRAVWPGATAEDTAREVTDRLEKALQSLQWIDYISSYTKPGEATLMVNLKDQTPPSAGTGSMVPGAQEDRGHSANSAAGVPRARSSMMNSAMSMRSSTASRPMASPTGTCAIAWNRSARSCCGFRMSAR